MSDVRVKRTILYLVGLVLVLGLWHSVFVMTGVLWWDAPVAEERLAAFEPVKLPAVDVRLVDVEAFLGTHAEWDLR